MSCVYCSDLHKYDLLPAERVITNVRGVWDKGDNNGPKRVAGHRSIHPLAAQPGWFVLCQDHDVER